MKHDNIYYISRSEGVERQNCRRKRLIGNDLGGLGYRPKAGSIPLLSGDAFHKGFSMLLGHYSGIKPLELSEPGFDPIEKVLDVILRDYQEEVLATGVRNLTDRDVQFTIEEQQTMLEGLMRGWVEIRLPLILEEYDVVEVEQQWLWKLGDGIYVPLRQDAILRSKATGRLIIMDYKGIPYGYDNWQTKHESSDQTVLYITALEERTGEPVDGIFYEGLIRGQWKKETAKFSPYSGMKIQHSALTYGYGNFDGEYPTAENNWAGVQSEYTNRKGWTKFRVRDRFTVPEWLEVLRRDGVLDSLFISMVPVNPAPEFRQRIRRQRYLNEVRYLTDLEKFNQLMAEKGLEHPDTQIHLDLFAEQNLEECPRYGENYMCPFKTFCDAPHGGLDLIELDGNFEPREPHHDLSGLIPLESLRRKAA